MAKRIRKSATDRKIEIQQAALDLAFDVGPDHVSTGMIAAKLGLTQPAFYKHFRHKEDIWHAIAEGISQRIAANIARAQDAEISPVARIRQLVLGHLALVRETPALPEIMVMRNASAQSTPTHRIVQSTIQISMGQFRTALEQHVVAAKNSAQIKATIDAIDAATLIFGIIQSLVLRLMITRNTAILLDDGERLLDLLLSSFAPTGETK